MCGTAAPGFYFAVVCYFQVDEGLKSLEIAMAAGFEQYEKIRNDKNVSNLRKSPKFKTLLDKYDEPVINWDAINSAFGFLKGMGKK